VILVILNCSLLFIGEYQFPEWELRFLYYKVSAIDNNMPGIKMNTHDLHKLYFHNFLRKETTGKTKA
jgi:hypothetical protein